MKKDGIYLIFEKKINSFCKLNPTINKFLIALSGGPDSTALFELFNEFCKKNNQYSIEILHILHDWGNVKKEWGEAATERKDYCYYLAKMNEIKIHLFNGKSEDFKDCTNGSLEAIGREMRHSFFKKKLSEIENSVVCLGHTKDDQIETFFIRLFRGASIGGLSCIEEFRNNLLRPLLDFSKIQLIDYLNEKNIQYHNDLSNYDERFLRGKIRTKLIPILNSIDDRFDKKIIDTIQNIKSANEFISSFIDIKIKNKNEFEIKEILNFSIFLQREFINKILYLNGIKGHKLTTNLINEILRFLKNKKSNKHNVLNLIFFKKKNICSINCF